METDTTPEMSAPAEGKTMAAEAGAEYKKMKVMVAVDDSDLSFYALRWALKNLCSNYSGQNSYITLVNVQPIFQPFIYPAGPVVYATPEVIDAVKKGRQENAVNMLSRALQICKENEIKAETLILEGDPKDKICQAAEELHIDLLVVGSRGLGAIKRALLGSVSNYCAHQVHCPVLIVKPPTKVAHE